MVIFDPVRMALAASWLVSMGTVPEVATEQAEKYALVPSLKPVSQDRYRPYRHDDAYALAAAVQRALVATG